jgi:hypothetical protein
MSQRPRFRAGLAAVILAMALLGVVGWINYENLEEAYGSGPPHYGRTTNMDKWSDPRPALLILDAVTLIVCGGLVFIGVRLMQRSGSRRPGSSGGA